MSTACCSQCNWEYLTTSTVLCTVFAVLRYHCVVLFVRGTVTVTCRYSWVTWRSVRVVIGIRGRREYVLGSQLGIVQVTRALVQGMKWGLLPDSTCCILVAWYLTQMLHVLHCRFGSNSPGYASTMHCFYGPAGPLLFNVLIPYMMEGLMSNA